MDATFKCSWKNGIIWAVLASVAAVALHCVMWWLTIGPLPETIASDNVYYMTRTLLVASFLLPALMYLLMYHGYTRIAGRNPYDLAAVARDRHGKPAILPLIVLLVLELLWTAVAAVGVYFAYAISINGEDFVVIECLLTASAGNLVADVILFLLGKRFFKPNQVQANH